MSAPAAPPVRDFGEPLNLDEQMAAARVLLALAREGMEPVPGWAGDDPRQQDLDVATAAVRRLLAAALEDCVSTAPCALGAAIAGNLGDHVGQLLRGLPDPVIERALTTHSRRFLHAVGADPARSGASITISSGQETPN